MQPLSPTVWVGASSVTDHAHAHASVNEMAVDPVGGISRHAVLGNGASSRKSPASKRWRSSVAIRS